MRRWTTTYRFAWTPVITFSMRRIQFLEWIEENLEPVAFTESADSVGIALVSRDIRLTVWKSGMSLEDGLASEAGVSVLAPALDGVLSVFEPKSAALHSASIAWSGEIPGVTYPEACARFGRRLSGLDLDDAGLLPFDAAVLMDVQSESYRGQVEWGVVSADELIQRLEQPAQGRIAENRPHGNLADIMPGELPEVSLFVDTSLTHIKFDSLSSRDGMEAAMADVEADSVQLATFIHERVAAEIGSTQ